MAWADDFTWVEKSTKLGPTNLNKMNKALRELKGLMFNPMDYAATGDGVTDDSTAIAAAATAARAAGGAVLVTKNHAYGSALTFDSVPVFGRGSGAKLTALNPASSQVNLTGTGAELHDITITCPTASIRSNSDLAIGVVVNASAFTLRNVIVDKMANGGFKFTGASRGKVIGCAARNTLADGFHVTGASSYLQFVGCEGYLTGDDTFSVVSNTTDSAAVSYVEWVGCISVSSSTAGFRVSGGTHVGIRGGSVKSPAGGGVMIEVMTGATTTYGNYDVQAQGVLIDSPGATVNAAGVLVKGIDASHLCEYTTIRDVTVKNSQSGNHAGIEVGAFAYDVTVDGSKALTTGNYGISVGINGSGGPPRDVRILNCTVDSPNLDGIYVDYCAGMLQIKDNVFRSINTTNTVGPAVVQFTANATSRNAFTGNQHLGSKVANLSKLIFANSLIVDTRGNYSESGCTIVTGGAAYGEIGYTAITSTVNVTATTSPTATTVVTAPAYVFDGITPVLIEADFSSYDKGTTWIVFVLYDGLTELGQWGFNTGLKGTDHIHLERRLTPAAGTHTYSIRAFVDAGTGHVYAGAGGVGQEMPSFIRLTIPSPPY